MKSSSLAFCYCLWKTNTNLRNIANFTNLNRLNEIGRVFIQEKYIFLFRSPNNLILISRYWKDLNTVIKNDNTTIRINQMNKFWSNEWFDDKSCYHVLILFDISDSLVPQNDKVSSNSKLVWNWFNSFKSCNITWIFFIIPYGDCPVIIKTK